MYLMSPIQDNSRKRPSANPHLANGHSTKRFRFDTIYNAFTDEQHAVIEQTASFFRIHPSDLAAAIGSLRSSSEASTYPHRPSYPTSFQQANSYVPSWSEDSFASQVTMGNEWETSSSSSRERTFGSHVPPASWASCFASFNSTDESTAPPVGNQMAYSRSSHIQTSPNGILSSTSRPGSTLPNYSDNPFGSPTYDDPEYDQVSRIPEDNSTVIFSISCQICADFCSAMSDLHAILLFSFL